MRIFVAFVALLAIGATPARSRLDYPSCDIAAQRGVRGNAQAHGQDALRSHFIMRVNILEADLGSARKAGRITAARMERLQRRLDRISHDADRLVSKQGFLSAAEHATYDRQLDAIALDLCH